MPDQQSNLQIVIKTVKQGTGDKEAQQGLGNLKGELGDLSQGLLGLNISSVGLTAGLMMAGKGALDLAYKGGESEASLTRLDAVLKATGGSAGMTMSTLTNLSQEMMFLTGTEDEEVQAAEAVLLTFRNMSEDVFPRTIRGAADLAAIFGGDLQSQTMILAKALSAPGEGMMALERETGKWDDAVKANILSLADQGKILDAQKLIFAEVEKRVGGAAAAMGNTYPGQVKKLNTAISELGEAFGKIFLPTLTNAVSALVLFLTWEDRINLALNQQSDNLIKTSKSYDEYSKKWVDAIHAAGRVTEEEAAALNKSLPPQAQHWQGVKVLTEAELQWTQAMAEAGYQTDAQREALEQQMPVLTEAVDKDEELTLAKEKLSRALSDQNEAVKYATGYAKEFGSYEENLAAAEAQLQADRKAGWWEVSQKIKDDKQAIIDLKDSHQKALDQMIVDLFTYKLELDKDLSPEDIAKKSLDLQLAFGLITQAEYDAAKKAIDFADALLALPKSVSTDFILNYIINSPKTPIPTFTPGWTPTSQQTGLDFTVPPDYEGDNYPLNLRVKSGERVKVETPDQQHSQGDAGGGRNGPLVGVLNNYNGWDREAASSWLRNMT